MSQPESALPRMTVLARREYDAEEVEANDAAEGNGSMATTAAAVLAKARRDVTDHFMSANAVSPDRAIGYQPARRMQRRMFERLLRNGTLVEVTSDKWYIDIPKYRADANTRCKRAIGMVGAAILAAAGLALLG